MDCEDPEIVTRYYWCVYVGGGVIYMELFKKFRFDHTNKWYRHNQQSVLENETHKILSDFDIQTDNLMSAKWPDLVIVKKKKTTASTKKKKKCRIVNFDVLADHRIKLKENKKRDQYLDLARELKIYSKVTVIPIVIGTVQGLEDLKIRGNLESTQTTALLRSIRILRRVPELEETHW